MRTLIISDLHANIDALLAVESEVQRIGGCDRTLVLGDLVDYGPAPAEVIEWVRRNATDVIRGNHDHAMATGAACQSSSAFLPLSIVTREYFRPKLEPDAIRYLQSLPAVRSIEIEGTRIELVHATLRDPLYEYVAPQSSEEHWLFALGPVSEDTSFVFLGHTHLPFTRRVGEITVVNPGSLGQPKDGDPRACYAILEGGEIRLCRISYDVEWAVSRLQQLSLPELYIRQLSHVLRTGRPMEV
jgi:putative phosphoesterase